MSLFGRSSPSQEEEEEELPTFPSAQPSPSASLTNSHDDENEVGPDHIATPLLLSDQLLADFTSEEESLSEPSSENEDDVHDSQPKQRLQKNTPKALWWLRHTANERAIAEGLQLVDATNLTKHVLDSHGVSARQYSSGVSIAKPWVSRREWIEGWMPRKNWTAWPKKPSHVPRRQDRVWTSSLVKKEVWRPGKDLEEALFALMLRKGREQWERREPVGSLDQNESQTTNQTSGSAPNMAKIAGVRTDVPVSISRKRTYDEVDEVVFCADDERQWRVLGPSVKSTLSKLDSLLVALHQSKGNAKAYVKHTKGEDLNSRPGKDQSGDHFNRLDLASAATDTEAMETSSSDSESNISESLDSEDSNSKRRQLVYDLQRELPRDWSQVLGFASIIGIPPEVISRTATRCAAAFNEGLSFMPMDEKKASSKAPDQVKFVPADLLNGPLPEHRLGHPGEIRITTELLTWNLDTDRKCPFPGCGWEVPGQHTKQGVEQEPKGTRGGGTRKPLREHLKRTHKMEHPESNSIEILKTKHGAVHNDGYMEPIKAQPGWRGRDRSKSQSQNRGGSRPGAGRKPKPTPVPKKRHPKPSVETHSEDVDVVDPALK